MPDQPNLIVVMLGGKVFVGKLTEAAAPPDLTAPAAPTGLAALPMGNGVRLTWTPNAESDLDHYEVQRSDDNEGTWATLAGDHHAAEYLDDSAVAGATYWYRVRAVDSSSNASDWSATVTGSRPSEEPVDETPPGVPTGLTATPSTSGIALDWDDSPASDFSRYRVYRSASSAGPWLQISANDLGTSAYDDTAAPENADSWYRVTALDTTGNESAPAVISARRPANQPASQPFPFLEGVPITGLMAPASVWGDARGLPVPEGYRAEQLRYQWEFFTDDGGAPSTTYDDAENQPQPAPGFVMGHTFDSAGTFWCKLTVTAPSGERAVYQSSIGIAADSRTAVYLDPEGAVQGDGTLANPFITTFSALTRLNALGADAKLMIKAGTQWSMSSAFNPRCDNLWVTTYGGADPITIYGSVQPDNTHALLAPRGTHTVFDPFVFDQTYQGTGKHAWTVLGPGPIATTMRGVTTANSGKFVNNNTDPLGVYIYDCHCTEGGNHREYFAWGQGTAEVYVGCTHYDPAAEHNFRMTGNGYTIWRCVGRKPLTDGSKTTLIMRGSYGYVGECDWLRRPVSIGPLDNSPTADGPSRSTHHVIERCAVTSYVEVKDGSHDIMVRNNVIHMAGDSARGVRVEGYSTSFARGCERVAVVNNTLIGSGTEQVGIILGTGAVDVEWANNLQVSTRSNGDASNAAGCRIDTVAALSGVSLWTNNVYLPSAAMRIDNPSGSESIAAFNERAQVGTDVAASPLPVELLGTDATDDADRAVEAFGMPRTPSAAQDAAVPCDGVWEDFYGTARSRNASAWTAGAVEA